MEMKKGVVIFGLVLIWVAGCIPAGKLHQEPLRVRDAFYYSWFAGESVRGTHIEIHITELSKDIRYDSVVFRGGVFPISSERSGNQVKLSASDAVSGFEQLDRRVPSDLPDQLIFTSGGKRHVQLLDHIRNDGMRYMKRE
jgi:hypothetical protein